MFVFLTGKWSVWHSVHYCNAEFIIIKLAKISHDRESSCTMQSPNVHDTFTWGINITNPEATVGQV